MSTVLAIAGAITAIGTIVGGFVYLGKKIESIVIALKPTQDQLNQKIDAMIEAQKNQAEQSGRPQ